MKLRVNGMFLGQVHPSLTRGKLIELPCMKDEEIPLVIEDQISRGDALCSAVPGDDAPFILPTKNARSPDVAHRVVCAPCRARPACVPTCCVLMPSKSARDMEVVLMRVPYPAWRRLLDLLWKDATFTYRICPRFLSRPHGTVELVLLLNGGPSKSTEAAPTLPGRRRLTDANSRTGEAGQRRNALAQERQQSRGAAPGVAQRGH